MNVVMKWRRVEAARGRPCLMTPEETQAVARHVRGLHDRGMTCRQICDLAGGLSMATCNDLVKGRRRSRPLVKMRRTTGQRFLSVRYVPPEGKGARVPSFGSRRRLQALNAIGFPGSWLAEQIPSTSRAYIHQFTCGRRAAEWMFNTTAQDVTALYDKLSYDKPEDYGIQPRIVNMVRTFARKRGYAPPHCWDHDTIDNPEAPPEWTGHCGTLRGYAIHLREKAIIDIVKGQRAYACVNCRRARTIERRWPHLGKMMGI